MPHNKSVNPSGYVFGDSTIKLLGDLLGDSASFLMVRRRVTLVVRGHGRWLWMSGSVVGISLEAHW